MTYDVDGLYIIADYYNVANIAIQAKDLGCDLQLFGPPMAVRQDTIDLGGKDVEELIAISVFPAGYEGEKFVKFSEDYQKLKGSPVNVHATLWYDTTLHLAQAINDANSTDADAIAKVIHDNEFEALACKITYNEVGDSIRSYFASKIVDGKWTYLDTFDPKK